jgi:hypothetical protein
MVRSGATDMHPQSDTLASPPSPGKRLNQTERLRAYNRSGERFLSLEVRIFDTTSEPLKKLFDYLASGSDTGLWLKPYRGIPAEQGAKLFDLVYLDEECRVTREVDSYPNPVFAVLEDKPASVLLLPAHTVFASQIQPGDQLAICESEELEGMLELLSSSTDADPVAQETESKDEKLATHDDLRSSTEHDRSAQRDVSQQPNARGAESSGRKRDSLSARIKRWFHPEPADNRSNRRLFPGLIAYHWSGGTPQAYHLGNISESGFYLLTDERPYPGTLILMTLQRTDSAREKLEDTIAVYTKVIRWGPDGVGFAFVTSRFAVADINNAEKHWADRNSLNAFLKRLPDLEQEPILPTLSSA